MGFLCFVVNFVEKWAQNRSKADKTGFHVLYLILLKNEPQIGRRPIKWDFYVFWLSLLKNEPQIGRSQMKEDFMFII
jgi:hypothetical protein